MLEVVLQDIPKVVLGVFLNVVLDNVLDVVVHMLLKVGRNVDFKVLLSVVAKDVLKR